MPHRELRWRRSRADLLTVLMALTGDAVDERQLAPEGVRGVRRRSQVAGDVRLGALVDLLFGAPSPVAQPTGESLAVRLLRPTRPAVWSKRVLQSVQSE